MENLTLIDWKAVGLGALWIGGLAVMLSTLGFAEYHAKADSRSLRIALEHPNYQVALGGGLAMFCLGLLGSSKSWWEGVAWGLLCAAALIHVAWQLSAWRAKRRD